MASRRPSPTPKKTIAIKRTDGDPLTRLDIQFDVLYYIFTDSNQVFTDPYPSSNGAKLSFHDLYIKAILNSPKATKALRDKMLDSNEFSEDFAMLALLVNVGRINTTMSFFPEMKTTIRTYHPIPALQRTNGNLQDAPRIKHILKTSLLESDTKDTPLTLRDLTDVASREPTTSITNLLFILANHSSAIGQEHFPNDNLDFFDLFLRGDVSSISRGRAFLWLCYFYLEVPHPDEDRNGVRNPFADPKLLTPTFVMLTEAQAAQENVDSEDDKIQAEKLLAQRSRILDNQGTKQSSKLDKAPGSTIGDEDEDGSASVVAGGDSGRGGGAVKGKTTTATAKEKKAAADKLRRERLKEQAKEKAREREREQQAAAMVVGSVSDDDYDTVPELSGPKVAPPSLQNQYPPHHHQYPPQPQPQPQSRPARILSGSPEPTVVNPHRHRYSPYYKKSPVPVAAHISRHSHRSHHPRPPSMPQRTMLQHAWHVITTSDPLLDSDEEFGDEHVRHDYIQRLQIISRLRGKEPTPEPERHSMAAANAPRIPYAR